MDKSFQETVESYMKAGLSRNEAIAKACSDLRIFQRQLPPQLLNSIRRY